MLRLSRVRDRSADREIVAYATGSLATGVFAAVPLVLLLFYCTEVLGLPATLATWLVVTPKVVAAGWDPLVGAWIDRHGGMRRPMIAGAAGVVVALSLLFATPMLTVSQTALWVGASFTLLILAVSLFAVPYIALPAVIAPLVKRRTRLVTWRMTASMVGVLVGGALAPAVVDAFGGGRAGYRSMGLLTAGVCALAMGVAITGVEVPARTRQADARLGEQLRRVLARPSFRRLAIAYVLQLTAVGSVSAALPYIVTRALGGTVGDAGTFMGTLLLVTIGVIPLWSRLGTRFGERRCLVAAALTYVIALAMFALAAGNASWVIALGSFALVGVPLAGLQVLPFALVAHMAFAGGAKVRSEVGLTGAWTAIEKIGLACGPGLTGVTFVLFPAGADLPAAILIGPALLALASILPLLMKPTYRPEV